MDKNKNKSASYWSTTILSQKYSHDKKDGTKETWEDVADRVGRTVLKAVGASKSQINETIEIIREKKFIPGGRYLYATGRQYHQVNNCMLFKATDSREGWAELLNHSAMALMTGAGIGIDYSDIRGEGKLIRKTGGLATGPLALAEIINCAGRGIQQGGSRRCLPKGTCITMADFSLKYIEDVKEGDLVHTRFGPKKVLATVNQGVQEVVSIETELGTVTSSLDHRWLSANGARTKTFSVPTKKLSLDCKLYRFPVPTPGGNDLDTNYAYTIGYFLGDGCAYSSNRTHEVTFQLAGRKYIKPQADRIMNVMTELGCNPVTRNGHGDCTEIRCRGKKLVEIFQNYKKPNEAFDIPDFVWSASLEARRAFLAGWFDADGSFTDDAWRLSNTHASTRLIIQSFLRGLGFLTTQSGIDVRVNSYQRQRFIDEIGKFMFKKHKQHPSHDTSEIPVKIDCIEKIGKFETYDLQIEEVEEFIADGFVSHNSAIWAGLKWSHPDIHKFIVMKNWSSEVRELKAKDFNFPATMDGTNISVQLDDEFFKAYNDDNNKLHAHAQSVYWAVVKQMLKTAEPGFSIDTGINSKETLRNAPVCGETHVLTSEGYKPVDELVGKPVTIWTGQQWAKNVIFELTNSDANIVKVALTGGREIRCDENHPFITDKGDKISAKDLQEGQSLYVSLPNDLDDTTHTFSCSTKMSVEPDYYTLGYVYGDGSFSNKGDAAEITFCTQESKECSKLCIQDTHLSSFNSCDGRGYSRAFYKTDRSWWSGRSKDIFPVDIYQVDKVKAASFVAGLFDADGNWEADQKRIRLASIHEGFLRGVARLLEQYGILAGVSKAGHSTYGKAQTYQLVVMSSYTKIFADKIPTQRLKPVLLNYTPYRVSKIKVLSVEEDTNNHVFCANVGVPEHSFQAEGIIISNCTELTSADDSDVCNLGSINLAKIQSLDDMRRVVELSTGFLLAGTVYSDVPYAKVDQVRSKNRRLGLGLMGIHEFLLMKGKQYGPDPDLGDYLKVYTESDIYAAKYAKEWDLSIPVKTRAIAPNGTISIVAETTSGIEPIYCVAYKRRYLKGSTWHYQYVIDPTAKRLIDAGVNPESIEDAYVLAEDVERRVAFQAWVQQFVDHAISSTINLPAWGTELNNDGTVQTFGRMLFKYLPSLRGITCYPDGGRSGQPLSPVSYKMAIKHTEEVFIEAGDSCSITKGESCGS